MTKTIEVEESSGNVFADIGHPNPEEALAKSRLAQRIAELIGALASSIAEANQLKEFGNNVS